MGSSRARGATLRRLGNPESGTFAVTFRDPRQWQDASDRSKGHRVVRRSLKTRDRAFAEICLASLNRILADPTLWQNPPQDTPVVVRELWGGESFQVTVSGGKVRVPVASGETARGFSPLDNIEDWVSSDEPAAFAKWLEVRAANPDWWEERELAAQLPPVLTKDAKLRSAVMALRTSLIELDATRERVGTLVQEIDALRNENKALRHRLQRYDRRAAKVAAVGTLQQELEKYLADVQQRKITHKRKGILRSTLRRFVTDVGPNRKADDIAEQDVSRYVQSYRQIDGRPISEERRREIRLQVCTFLETATNFMFSRKAVVKVSAHKVAREKKPIVWLEGEEVTALLKQVYADHGDYWGDLATMQAYMGFRPSELLLLQTAKVTKEAVELEPIMDESTGVSHAKTGARAVKIPNEVARIIDRRVRASQGPFLFGALRRVSKGSGQPSPRRDGRTGLLAAAWNEDVFFKQYTALLRAAATKAKIKKPIDGRTLRRTFGSIAIRSGYSVEEVARVMGDRASTIRKHYARIEAREVDITSLTLSASIRRAQKPGAVRSKQRSVR